MGRSFTRTGFRAGPPATARGLRARFAVIIFLFLSLTLGALAAGCSSGGKPAGGETKSGSEAKPEEKKSGFPARPIEFVVPFSPGGGSDNLARMISAINDKQKILGQPLAVINKPGGSGAVGMAYVQNKKGDPYVIMTAVPQVLTAPLTTGSTGTVHWTKLTPIALIGLDEFMIVVKSDAPYKDLKDLVAAAKAKPKSIKWGGSEVGSEDSIVTDIFSRKAGLQVTYVPFKSGGEVMTALLGGNVDVAWANPNEALAQMEAKKLRVLAVASPERLKGAKDIPTLKESGYDVVWNMFRGIMAPADIKAEEKKALAEYIKKITETETWKKDYLETNMITGTYLGSDEFAKLLKDKEEEYRGILKNLGILK